MKRWLAKVQRDMFPHSSTYLARPPTAVSMDLWPAACSATEHATAATEHATHTATYPARPHTAVSMA
jgi:hypothetical protein